MSDEAYEHVKDCDACRITYQVLPKPKPQTWSLPPEPGPEVKAVRGTYQADGKEPVSVLLRSEFNGGAWMGPAMGYPELGGCFPYSWPAALAKFGPLTDATHELEE